jgi:threonine dehydrogenase-like Zn-dependent dehydrogenase
MSAVRQTGSRHAMRAAVLHDVRRIEVRELLRPDPRPHEVLVRVQAVGLCGTDVHIFEGFSNYNRDRRGRLVPLTEQPQILGHEITGVVEEVGRDVDDLRTGDRVVVDQGRTCMGERRSPLCEYCESGDSHQCEYYGEHGITGLPGGFAEFLALPALNAVKLDNDPDPAVAAMTEPLGCVIHAGELTARTSARYELDGARAERRVRTLLVCGGGPAGLLFTQYFRKVVGFEGVILLSEPSPLRRSLAERFGATTIDPTGVDLTEAVRDSTDGRMVELVVEATGIGEVFARIPELLRKQGTVVLYGHGHTGVSLGVLNQLQFLEPTLVSPVGASGAFDSDGRPTVFRRSLSLIEDGIVEVEPMITHRFPSLDSVDGALRSRLSGTGYVKGVVVLGATSGDVENDAGLRGSAEVRSA